MKRLSLFGTIISLLTGTMVAQEYKLTSSDGQGLDYFGAAVDAEGENVYIGARLDDDAGTDAGAVYTFVRDSLGWIENQKLLASDGQVDGRFGRSVSVDGDYLIVGAHRADNTAGAAYVFFRNGGVWSEQAKLSSSDPDSTDYFGLSVGISGEFAVIGAFGDDEGGDSTGAAYIFRRTGTTWSQVTKLMASDGEPNDRFGWAVAMDGDYAVIGSHGDDDLGSASGAVYIFHHDGVNWTEQTKLTASNGTPSDDFGFAVDIRGSSIIVGAPNADNTIGEAYVFVMDNMVWSEAAILTASDRDTSDEFGTSVAIDGGIAVIGAGKKEDSTGAAYVFEQIGGSWPEAIKLRPIDLNIGDEFGRDVAVTGFSVVAGALEGDGAAVNSGAVWVYENVTVDVAPSNPATIPAAMKLNQNYPNPFNPTTSISYTLAEGSDVELTVHNLLGQKIRTLVREFQGPGAFSATWDGLSAAGHEVTAGIYFYRLTAGSKVYTRKMTLLK